MQPLWDAHPLLLIGYMVFWFLVSDPLSTVFFQKLLTTPLMNQSLLLGVMEASHNDIRCIILNYKLYIIFSSFVSWCPKELEHQNALLTTELQAAKNTWLKKTLGSFRTAANGHQNSSQTDPAWSPANNPHSSWVTRRLSWAHREGRAAKVWKG